MESVTHVYEVCLWQMSVNRKFHNHIFILFVSRTVLYTHLCILNCTHSSVSKSMVHDLILFAHKNSSWHIICVQISLFLISY